MQNKTIFTILPINTSTTNAQVILHEKKSSNPAEVLGRTQRPRSSLNIDEG